MKIIFHHPRATIEHFGFIPTMLSEDNPKPAKEQLHDGYGHGGGWDPFKGFKLQDDDSPLAGPFYYLT